MAKKKKGKASKTITWENDDKEMIHIPGGEFTMGSDESRDNESPAHTACVDAFYIIF